MKRNKAFSLIELSIVILIIGILIAGVTQSSRLIKQFKLTTARTMTQSSAVASIKGLITWWETSSEASYNGVYPEDGAAVATWYDTNPQSSYKNNALSGTAPIFTDGIINGLPVLRFTGASSQFYTFDGTYLSSVDGYTIFIVGQRRATGAALFLAASSGTTVNARLDIGYSTGTNLKFAQHTNTYDVTVSDYSIPTATIHSFVFSPAVARTYYANGVSVALTAGGSASNIPLVSYANATVARSNSSYSDIDLGEIIMFNRALKIEERQSVEAYLGKKWGIKVN